MYWVNKIIRKLFSRPLSAPSTREIILISNLQARIRELADIGPADATSGVERFWLEKLVTLRRELLCNDPRQFLNFPVIRETMFVDDPQYIGCELKVLRSTAEWESRWRSAIRESASIPAPACPYFRKSSGNLIHQASHIWQFEQVTGLDVSRFSTILEFGGGYGGMCRLVHQLGFRGRYFIFDFPEFSALQEFYLRANDIPASSCSGRAAGAVCFSDFSQFEKLTQDAPADLVIAAWSLSETPLDFRRQVLGAVRTRHWLIGFQHVFESLDNADFFATWSRQNSTWRWRLVAAGHIPGRHSYLVGTQLETF